MWERYIVGLAACRMSPASPFGLRRGSLRYDRACRAVARGASEGAMRIRMARWECGLPSRSSRPQPAFALWASAWQPSLASRAKAGGEGRTRTFEAMRRLIYSQLPLPLGTLPRPPASGTDRPSGGGPDHG